MRIASKAADRVEDQIDGANITQATVAFGVATEKAMLLMGEQGRRRTSSGECTGQRRSAARALRASWIANLRIKLHLILFLLFRLKSSK
jgi:hypothetical protein